MRRRREALRSLPAWSMATSHLCGRAPTRRRSGPRALRRESSALRTLPEVAAASTLKRAMARGRQMNTESEDRVRARAYAIWEREGQLEGGAERHWTQAEEEERAEAGAKARRP